MNHELFMGVQMERSEIWAVAGKIIIVKFLTSKFSVQIIEGFF